MVGFILFCVAQLIVTLHEAFLLPSPFLPHYVSTHCPPKHIPVSTITPMKFLRAGLCLSPVSVEDAQERADGRIPGDWATFLRRWVTPVPLFLCLVYRVLFCCGASESLPFPSAGREESDRHGLMSLLPRAL